MAEEKFLENLKAKILWKDSFGFGHGEFSHSYQWLAIGKMLRWGQKTADLYSKCGEIKSTKEIWILSNKTLVKQEQVSLWQWLVDAVSIKEELPKNKEGNLPEIVEYNQHCFTRKTFRNANEVQKVLLDNSGWFLGYYAKRRSDALDTLSKVQLNKEGAVPNKKGQFQPRESLAAQQRALHTKYDSKVNGRIHIGQQPTLDGGVFSGSVMSQDSEKPAHSVTFHGKEGKLRDQRTY